MVVGLAVEDDPARLVLVRERLVAAGAIDDRQAPEAQRAARVVELADVVRPAMADRFGHGRQRRVDRGIQRSSERDGAADSAHGLILISDVGCEVHRHHALESEALLGPCPSGVAQRASSLGARQEVGHRPGQCLGIARRDEDAGAAVLDHFGVASHGGGDDGKRRRHGFQNRDSDTPHGVDEFT
jgi:hypothetical protein